MFSIPRQLGGKTYRYCSLKWKVYALANFRVLSDFVQPQFREFWIFFQSGWRFWKYRTSAFRIFRPIEKIFKTRKTVVVQSQKSDKNRNPLNSGHFILTLWSAAIALWTLERSYRMFNPEPIDNLLYRLSSLQLLHQIIHQFAGRLSFPHKLSWGGKWIFTRLGQRGDHSARGYHADIHSRGRIPLRMSTKNDILQILWGNFVFSVRKWFYAIFIVFPSCFHRILSDFPARGCAALLFFKANAIEFM